MKRDSASAYVHIMHDIPTSVRTKWMAPKEVQGCYLS